LLSVAYCCDGGIPDFAEYIAVKYYPSRIAYGLSASIFSTQEDIEGSPAASPAQPKTITIPKNHVLCRNPCTNWAMRRIEKTARKKAFAGTEGR